MNRKSFLRGFGTGVLFTTVILGLSFLMHTTKNEVISKARQYGMVFPQEDTLFAQASPAATANDNSETEQNPQDTAEAAASTSPAVDSAEKTSEPKDTVTPKPTPKPTTKPTSKPTPKPTAKPTAKPTKKPTAKPKSNKGSGDKKNTNTKTLTIVAGEWSDAVCRKLKNMGIISNAKDFDRYLNDNGYSSRISAGTYEVSVGDSYQELARKITRGR